MIKKANAAVSLLCCVTLLGHYGTMVYSLLTGWYSLSLCKNLAYANAAMVSVHVGLVLILFFFFHDSSNLSRYPKENKDALVQRISALVILLLLHAHVKNYGFIMSRDPLSLAERIRIIVMEVLFFEAVFSHVGTSVGKALVSLGLITRRETLQRVNKALHIGTILLNITASLSMIRFVVGFGG